LPAPGDPRKNGAGRYQVGKVPIQLFRSVYPTPAALITSVSVDGRPNIITLGEVFNISLSQPPVVGIAIRKERYSHELISATKQFVINLPGDDILEETDRCGTCTGRDVDKFAETGLTALPALEVDPPLIKECPVNIECRLTGIQEVGDHDLFLGKVQAVHADQDVIDLNGHVDPAKLRAFCFMFNHGHRGEYWSLGRKIGDLWFTRRE
jgi:flavin reductase (DIM6/NTAB) family NADH-FMN oxidoreductase RutF